jgi:glycine cleavage system aminomethyltransferase T/glycine/D-amino acid oxidase-like deaminating enzyme
VVDLPQRARIVIIGGGVGGTSIAYHLAERGERDVLLVDRAELTSGSTFHSAGLVGQLRGSVTLTRMMMYSAQLYRKLAADAETDPGWVECGGLRLASSTPRMEELERQVGWAETFGLPLHRLSAAQAQELFPLMTTDGVLGATFLPTDGYLDPSQLAYSLARGARAGGVTIAERVRVESIDQLVAADGRFLVRTDQGDVLAETVVDAGGMYGAQIARMVGVRVPIIAMSHQYVVTKPFRDVSDGRRLPTLRDPDLLIYYREDGAGLVMGGYERHCAPFALGPDGFDDVPADFNGRLLPEEWSRLEEIFANSVRRTPAMADVEIRKIINGPEGFTPDNEFCLGATDVPGFFVAAGFCAHGIAGAGAVGMVMANWVLDGDPGMDLWEMDVRRFGRQYRSPSYTRKRVIENYETYYDIKYPGHERLAGRPLRTGPAYPWHVEHGAAFGEKSGWERVNYYTSNARAEDEALRPRGWAGQHWSPAVVAEHLGTRTAAGLFDESSFAKIEVSGPGAVDLMEWLCDNRVARGVGRITYTQLLNARGGVEADVTVTQIADDAFLVVTGTAYGTHDLAWIRTHAPADGSVQVRDVTDASVVFGLWGPQAREILAPLTPQALDNSAFAFMTSRETTVGDVPARMLRVTFVGELGWEIHAPVEYGLGLWRTLWEAGRDHGLVAAGYHAIDSLRAEKGYRYWASDVTPDDTPDEAGLGFCVRSDKEFLGSTALVRSRATRTGVDGQPARNLACLTLADPRQVVLGNEPIRIGGATVGRVTTGAPGYTVERSIAFGYVPADSAVPGTPVEVLVFGEWVAGEVAAAPLFDPDNTRIRV